MLNEKQIEIIEIGFELRGNLENALIQTNCSIIFDDYDGEWNRITTIIDNNDKSEYHFVNGIYDDSW